MNRGRGAEVGEGANPGRRAVRLVLLAAVTTLAACTAPQGGGLPATPGPGATSSLVPPDSGTPAQSSSATGPASSSAPGPASPAPALASPVQGVVLHVDLAGLGKVTGFRLLIAGGRQVDFRMGVQENAAEFPAAHLSEHMASAEPVAVWFRLEGQDLVVYRLDDVAAASPSGDAGSPFPASS